MQAGAITWPTWLALASCAACSASVSSRSRWALRCSSCANRSAISRRARIPGGAAPPCSRSRERSSASARRSRRRSHSRSTAQHTTWIEAADLRFGISQRRAARWERSLHSSTPTRGMWLTADRPGAEGAWRGGHAQPQRERLPRASGLRPPRASSPARARDTGVPGPAAPRG